MNIKEILQKSRLSPLDTEILLSLAINMPKEYLFAHPEKKLNESQIERYKLYVTRRLRGEPIAYITGKKEFYGLEFNVNKNVLIPRPETELLAEFAIKNILNSRFSTLNSTLIDIGTGSGNIIISIVKNLLANTRKKINFYATDISKKALEIARKNARKHKVAKYIKFIQSDLLEFVCKKKVEGNIIIVANLPYVSGSLYKKNKDNLKYEPKTALISKNNGLGHYSKLLKQIKQICVMRYKLCVTCYVEISPEQKNALAKIVKRELPPAKIKFFKDLSGRIRVAEVGMGKKIHQGKIDKI